MATRLRRSKLGRRLLVACGLFALMGCGGLKLVPVSGTVKLGNKALTGGGLSFVPDATKGNNAHVACVGRIGPDGRYEVQTTGVKASERGTGVPLGWYKVTYVSLRDAPPIKIHPKYLSADNTPLSVEVVADPRPGQYDFQLE